MMIIIDDGNSTTSLYIICYYCRMPIDFAPPFIIFINNDLSAQVQSVFQTQLYITMVVDGPTFDASIATDPNYPLEIHESGQRLLVIRDLHDLTNRQFADIVLFAKNGLVSVLVNHYGPPGKTLAIDRVYLTDLLHHNFRPCRPFWGRPDIYDGFKGHPEEAYDRNYDPWRLDPKRNIEPVDD